MPANLLSMRMCPQALVCISLSSKSNSTHARTHTHARTRTTLAGLFAVDSDSSTFTFCLSKIAQGALVEGLDEIEVTSVLFAELVPCANSGFVEAMMTSSLLCC